VLIIQPAARNCRNEELTASTGAQSAEHNVVDAKSMANHGDMIHTGFKSYKDATGARKQGRTIKVKDYQADKYCFQHSAFVIAMLVRFQ
jgi:hypothetical protein